MNRMNLVGKSNINNQQPMPMQYSQGYYAKMQPKMQVPMYQNSMPTSMNYSQMPQLSQCFSYVPPISNQQTKEASDKYDVSS